MRFLSSSRLPWPVLLVCLLLLAGTGPQTALAHALLVRSQPQANAELLALPAAVDMWFSEPLERSFSSARLLDAAGEEVLGAGPSTVDGEDPTHMRLPLPELEPGIYTVVWTTLSSVDGHEWIGSFPLTLLHPDGSAPTGGAAAAVTGDRGELPSPLEAAARWLSLLGAILLAGGLLFRAGAARSHLLWRRSPTLAGPVHRVWRLVAVAALAAIFLGGWLQVGGQVAALAAPQRLFELLTGTRSGRLVLLRQLLLIPAAALLVAGTNPARLALGREQRSQWRSWLEGLVAVGMLATFPFASHAAAVPGRAWAVLGDSVHLLAAGVWMGGLLSLALLLWRARSGLRAEDVGELGRIVRRFSLWAAGAVFVLTVSGLFSSAVQLPSLASLWTSIYGRLLLAKIALVGLALAVAFLNRRMVHRDGGAGSSLGQLARQVRFEALVSLGLLLVVALLVQTPPPPRPQPYVAPALPFNNIVQADDLLVHLQIKPNTPGNNRFWTHLYHADTSPIGEVQLVRLFFAPKRAGLGQARTDLPVAGEDIFEDSGAWMGQSGDWDVTVYVRRRGLDDVTATFAVTLPPPPGVVALGTPWQNPAAGLSARLVWGGLLLAIGLIPFLWWRPLRRRRFGRAGLLGGAGAACLLVGVVLTVQGWAADETRTATQPAIPVALLGAATPGVAAQSSALPTISVLATVSPLPTLDAGTASDSVLSTPTPLPSTVTPTPTPDDAFQAGAAIFHAHCETCHGPHGMGDGPAAATLPVPPAVLPFHIPLHPDEDIYVFVSGGFPDLGMPAFQEILSQEEILQVVRYLRVRFDPGGQR